MHQETDFNLKKLRKRTEECYVESKLVDSETVNLVVTTTGFTTQARTEQAVMQLSKKKIALSNSL